jgi:hypothetical protein
MEKLKKITVKTDKIKKDNHNFEGYFIRDGYLIPINTNTAVVANTQVYHNEFNHITEYIN